MLFCSILFFVEEKNRRRSLINFDIEALRNDGLYPVIKALLIFFYFIFSFNPLNVEQKQNFLLVSYIDVISLHLPPLPLCWAQLKCAQKYKARFLFLAFQSALWASVSEHFVIFQPYWLISSGPCPTFYGIIIRSLIKT